MRRRETVAALLADCRPGHCLPQGFYTDPDVHAFDLDEIFGRSWLMVGLGCEMPDPGSRLAMTIGRTPVVILRDRDGSLRGLFNSCRHRGARVCAEGPGRGGRLVCPYHRWTYDIDGRLLHAPTMPEAFDAQAHGLRSFPVREVAGAVYACLAADPPEFDGFARDLEPMLAPMGLTAARLAHVEVLVEKANWKLVMENARECYHCAACHPELGVSFPVAITPGFSTRDAARMAAHRRRMDGLGLSCGPFDGPWWQIARFPLNEGALSLSRDGQPVVRRPLCSLDPDMGALRFATEPHNFCYALGDHAFAFSCYPTGPEESVVVGKWYVHRDAVEGVDYDRARLVETWDTTNRQDRDLAENNQIGVNGLGYQPGPYSPAAEALVLRFSDWYRDRVRAALDRGAPRVAEVA